MRTFAIAFFKESTACCVVLLCPNDSVPVHIPQVELASKPVAVLFDYRMYGSIVVAAT